MVRLLLALLAGLLVVPLCVDVLLRTIAVRRHAPEDPIWVAAGLIGGVVLIFTRRPNWLVHTILHETCHLLACVLLGVRVHRIEASDGRGGVVEHAPVGPLRTLLIALAPYVVPLVLAPLLLARWLTPEGPARGLLSFLAAVAYVTHLTGVIHNVRLNLRDPKGDLAAVGRPLALLLILAMGMLVTALAIRVLWEGSWSGWR